MSLLCLTVTVLVQVLLHPLSVTVSVSVYEPLVFDELIFTEEAFLEPDMLEPHPETDHEYESNPAGALYVFCAPPNAQEPLEVMPQLGGDFGAAVTEALAGLTQPLTVCVTV